MRQSKHLILLSLLITTVLLSCKKEEPAYYTQGHDGIYFDVASEEDAQQSYNFNKHVLEVANYHKFEIPLKTIGYTKDYDRKIVIKTLPVKGYDLLPLELPKEIILPKGEQSLSLWALAPRPSDLQKKYAIRLELDSLGVDQDFGPGISGKHHFTIFVEESYSDEAWSMKHQAYFGEWSTDKFLYLVNLTRKATLVLGQNEYASVAVKAVNDIRQYNEEHPDHPKTFGLPFYKGEGKDITEYEKPNYWKGNIETYLGQYEPKTFSILAEQKQITTQNELAYFTSLQPKDLYALNKIAYESMVSNLALTYKIYEQIPINETISVPYVDVVEYDLPLPQIWIDGADLLREYYGDPSQEKYLFMLKTAVADRKEHGYDYYNPYCLFPVSRSWTGAMKLYNVYGSQRKRFTFNKTQEGLEYLNKLFRKADKENKYNFPERL